MANRIVEYSIWQEVGMEYGDSGCISGVHHKFHNSVWYMCGITNSGAVQNNFLVMRRLLVRERRVNTSLAKAASGRGWLDLPVR